MDKDKDAATNNHINDTQTASLPPDVKVDEGGNVIAADSASAKMERFKEDERQKNIKAMELAFDRKRLAARLGMLDALEGKERSATRFEYMNILYANESFKKKYHFLDARAVHSLLSKQGYELYLEGYDYQVKILNIERQQLLASKYRKFIFNSPGNIKKYIRAAEKILYNADKRYLKENVIKLTTWAQWLRKGLGRKKEQKLMDSSMLIFYSAIGGTGKTELLRAFAKACSQLSIESEFLSTASISGRFAPERLKQIDVAIIEDANWIGSYSRDVNIDKINALIDRSVIDYERKGKNPESLKTNMTLIGGTNQRIVNRRFSIIPFNEKEIDPDDKTVPSPEDLTRAWQDLIVYCPDIEDAYYNVKTINYVMPNVVSEEMFGIYDYFTSNAEGSLYETKSVRSIIRYLIGKDKETPRRRDMIIKVIKELIRLEIAQQIKPKSNSALMVSKIQIDLEKFQEYIDESQKACSSEETIENTIVKLYVIPIKCKLEEKVMDNQAELDSLRLDENKEFDEKKATKNLLRIIDLETDNEVMVEVVKMIGEIEKLIVVDDKEAEKPPG